MPQFKQERRRLSGVHLDNTLMFPGVSVFTWIKSPGMPWVLLSIESEHA